MTLRAQSRWRRGLGIAAGVLLVTSVLSCIWGLWLCHDDGSFRQLDIALARATIYAASSDRSSRSATMSRLPVRGWSCRVDRVIGTPIVEMVPHFDGQSAPKQGWAVRLPLWIPLVLLAGPAGWMWWRHYGRPLHQCAKCGYDLRGVAGTKCPECGSPSVSPFDSGASA